MTQGYDVSKKYYPKIVQTTYKVGELILHKFTCLRSLNTTLTKKTPCLEGFWAELFSNYQSRWKQKQKKTRKIT